MISLKHSFYPLILVAFITFFISCDTQDPYSVDYSSAPEPFPISEENKVESSTGLIYYLVEEGKGPESVTRRSSISLFYTGRTIDGDVFDSSYRNGSTRPSNFSNIGTLISGFKEGLMGMKEGEKRVLIIPPELGYGGSPNHSLSDDTLRFDIELDEIAY